MSRRRSAMRSAERTSPALVSVIASRTSGASRVRRSGSPISRWKIFCFDCANDDAARISVIAATEKSRIISKIVYRMCAAGTGRREYNPVVDFFEVVKQRRSVRSYTSQEVETDKVTQVLEAADAAPSAGNLQAYEIFRVTSQSERAALAKASGDQAYVAQAPVVLVFCANGARAGKYGERGATLYAVQDATIACTFAMLAATTVGLATVWVGAFDDTKVQEIIGRSDVVPVAILPVGYAAEQPQPTARRGISDLVHG